MVYTGQSPDEVTLVETAQTLGFQFRGIDRGMATVRVFDKDLHFKILYYFEFDSDRKRSTVIVRDEQNRVLVLVKGADNVMKEIMKEPCEHLQEIDCFLDDFSKTGLRTLCFGYREVDEEWVVRFG